MYAQRDANRYICKKAKNMHSLQESQQISGKIENSRLTKDEAIEAQLKAWSGHWQGVAAYSRTMRISKNGSASTSTKKKENMYIQVEDDEVEVAFEVEMIQVAIQLLQSSREKNQAQERNCRNNSEKSRSEKIKRLQ